MESSQSFSVCQTIKTSAGNHCHFATIENLPQLGAVEIIATLTPARVHSCWCCGNDCRFEARKYPGGLDGWQSFPLSKKSTIAAQFLREKARLAPGISTHFGT
ncbi:hypothetical protein [Curvibacter fontanus]